MIAPSNAIYFTMRGVAHSFTRTFNKALDDINKAIELGSQDPLLWSILGDICGEQAQYPEAIEAYKTVIKLAPENEFAATAHYNLARIYIAQGKLGYATEELKERIKLKPDNTFAPLVALGILAYHNGSAEYNNHLQNALSQWEQAWEDRLQSPADMLLGKSKALLCIGQEEEAIQVLEEALKQMTSSDVIELDDYFLLLNAPIPPNGIKNVITILEKAKEKKNNF